MFGIKINFYSLSLSFIFHASILDPTVKTDIYQSVLYIPT